MTPSNVDIAIVGAGVAGIATAYYLSASSKQSLLLIDSRQPMSFTSAQSGDNYRNWWPHATMAAFTNDSIDELDRLAVDSDNVFNMTRGGYVLASRKEDIASQLAAVGGDIDVEVVSEPHEIGRRFPALSDDIKNVMHIARGGDISGQQLGQYMLQRFRAAGGQRLIGDVADIKSTQDYELTVRQDGEVQTIRAGTVVNAAGPFAKHVARMLDVNLPIDNIYQQKIAFRDTLKAIPRDMPFSIDLDRKVIDWTAEERALLGEDNELAWLLQEFPGGTHCRPEGGAAGEWVKLGWAYNETVGEPQQDMASEPAIDEQFPEIVIRGAAAFIPRLKPYIESPPTRFSHYGGYYSMTKENWPLIGPLDDNSAFVVAALSGFGSMSACAAGKLCAAHISGAALPDYAAHLSLQRYDNEELIASLAGANKGLL